MRSIVSILVSAVLVGCVGTPHSDPTEISAFEVSVYKAGMGMGCRDQGKGRGDPPEAVARRCKCALDTLNARLSEDEWRRATFFAQQKRDRDEAQVMAPHMAAVKECK